MAHPSNGLMKDSGPDAFQSQSISLAGIVRRIGTITPAEIDAVATAVAMCVGAP